jgi:hypothetical protein
MQSVFLAADNYGMPRIGAPGVADDYLGLVRQIVNDFSLPFITPLGADNDYFHVYSFFQQALYLSQDTRKTQPFQGIALPFRQYGRCNRPPAKNG